LNSGAADYVITGCGTGEGAMLACNSFPKVLCGHIESPLDAYLFSQVNDGNCVALPFAENFGWGGELNLEYIFEKLFCTPGGGGYPKERVEPEQRNKKILDAVKEVTHADMVTILQNLDRELVKGALSGEKFAEYFFADCKCDKIAAAVKEVLA
ncbi:MAG: RpiB/LacA/LacB family sugar-phosphate isomerase, partial [Lachnospiraceae bacterium]|nr:RpiB/LacA/LacB family sugar-phosphate isomerase [Lachnospiraceae bacterium]